MEKDFQLWRPMEVTKLSGDYVNKGIIKWNKENLFQSIEIKTYFFIFHSSLVIYYSILVLSLIFGLGMNVV